MVLTPLRVLLLIAGVLVAGALAYLFGIFDPQDEQPAVAVNAPVSEMQAEGETVAEDEADDAPVVAEAGEETAINEDQIVVPAFDLLRAEPDGSLVIAGRAEAGAEVEIISGSSILAKAKAGPSGDFAAILEKPLEPGEHNIVLRATSTDRMAATSLETAIVSIPTAESGQVVALVQQPGEPSRLITAPVAETQKTGEPQQMAEAQGELSSSGKEREESEVPADTSSEPEDGGEADSGADAPESGEPNPNIARSDAGEAQPQDEESASELADKDVPFIEAVEIDGREVFVAGRASPGHTVRVYANDILLGQSDISPEGRFLIEAERDLPVGDYIVRADVLSEDDSTVIARAAVPFERQEGEKISAVAPQTRSPRAAPQTNGAARNEDQGNETPQGISVPNGEGRPDEGPQTSAAAEGGAPFSGATHTQNAQDAMDDRGNRPSSSSDGGQTELASSGMTSPALEPVDGSVIIRRGDTLWHISRRVYGRGIRYTTIYLANQSQISDPDLIWPGQVFTVPKETEEGEKADLDAIGGQAAEPGTTAQQSAQ